MNSKSKSDIKMTKGAVKASPYGWSVGLHIVTKAISAGSYLMPFIAGLFYPGLMEGPIFISGCILAIFFYSLNS